MNRSPDWEELLQGCLNGTLDEAQEQELARLLQESSEAREILRSFLQIEGGVLTLAKAGYLSASIGLPSEESGIVPVNAFARPQPSQPSLARTLYRRIAVGFAVLSAVVLLILGGIHWLTPSPVVPPPLAAVAHVVELEGSVEIVSPAGEVRAVVEQQPLLPGDSLRTGEGNSLAVIELADRTRLELSPETAIRLPEDGSPSVQLIAGVVRGHEAEHAQRPPLVVTTSAARVRVEGDRFVLSSASSESLRVDMEAGRAEVVRQRDLKSLTAQSGAAIFVSSEVEDMIVGAMPRFVMEPRRILPFPGAWTVFFEPDGQHILAASYREIQRFDPDAPVEKTPLSTDTHHGRLAAFSRDGNTLAVYRGLRKDDPVILWDVRRRQQQVRIDARITDQRFVLAPDASWLATVERTKTQHVCRVWDGKTGAERFVVPETMRMNCVAATPDSKHLAVGLVHLGRRESNKIAIFDAQTGKLVAVLPTRAYPLTALAFSPDGRYLAAGITGLVQIWDVEKRELVRTIRGFERVLMTLTFSPNGTLLAGGTQDGQVWIWKATTGAELQVIQAGTSGVRLLAFTPDGRSLITGGIKHHPLMMWDVMPQSVQRPERRPLDKT